MHLLVFEHTTWEDYESLRDKDKILHKNLKKILKQIIRDNPSEGYGKPEKLKHSLTGLLSRRISMKDRLIYSFDDTSIYIFAIGGHYENK